MLPWKKNNCPASVRWQNEHFTVMAIPKDCNWALPTVFSYADKKNNLLKKKGFTACLFETAKRSTC